MVVQPNFGVFDVFLNDQTDTQRQEKAMKKFLSTVSTFFFFWFLCLDQHRTSERIISDKMVS